MVISTQHIADTIYFDTCINLDNWWAIHSDINIGTYRYVNAGMMVGTARVLLDMWSWCLKSGIQYDQNAMCHFINTYPKRCMLDTTHKLFFNDNYAISTYDYSDDFKIILNGSTISPYFIHFPGFLLLNSVPIWQVFTGNKFGTGKNYIKIGKKLLGSDFMPVNLVDERIYFPMNITNIIFIIGSVIIIFVLIVLLYRKRSIVTPVPGSKLP